MGRAILESVLLFAMVCTAEFYKSAWCSRETKKDSHMGGNAGIGCTVRLDGGTPATRMLSALIVYSVDKDAG